MLANSREGGRQLAARPTPPRRLPEIMMVIVSLLVLGSALFVILSNRYDSGSQKWAYGVVGSIIGFWLKPSR